MKNYFLKFAVNSVLPVNQTDMLANPYRPLSYKQHSSELPNIMDHPCEI